MPFMPRPPLLCALVLCALLAACDTGELGDDGNGPPPGDLIVEGVNLTELFRPPTPAEMGAVRTAWAARDAGLGARYAFEFVTEVGAADGADLRVYRARGEGDTVLFHGVVRLPPRPPGDVRRRALLLVLPDGDGGTSASVLSDGTLPIRPEELDDLVLALLAYRGEPLDVEGVAFASEAAPSPYDLDPDDALAFAGFVRGLGGGVLVDPARVGVLGLGRGGGTALLTEPRQNPWGVVVDLAGPTDFFLESFRDRVAALLRGQDGGALPGIEALAEEIVYPLRDSLLTVEQARFELLRCSARYFAAVPPFVAVAHGAEDLVVPVQHSRALDLSMDEPTGETTWVNLEVAGADHTSLLDEGAVVELVSDALREHLDL
jgi:hypothetical protein